MKTFKSRLKRLTSGAASPKLWTVLAVGWFAMLVKTCEQPINSRRRRSRRPQTREVVLGFLR